MQNTNSIDQMIVNVDMSNFVAEVIEKSMQIPVIVQFWAARSELCQTLGRTLEKVITEAGGAVRLAKANVDENQEIAAQMKIRSVPTVVAFVEGRPVDAFAGAKSDSEIREFLTKIAPELGPSDIEKILILADELHDQKNYQDASTAYSQALQLESDNPQAIAGLAQCLIQMDDLENAEHILLNLTGKQKNNPAVSAALARLDTAKQIGSLGDLDTLKSAVKKKPKNHQARFDLALALWATEARDEAADQLISIIATDKEWNDDGARKQLLKFFEMAGPMDPFTVSARRKLSSLLFS